MTRYYAEAGTPPGVWLGSGVREFGAGQLTVGAEVTPSQLELLLVHGRDPITGKQLGRGYPTYPSMQGRSEEHTSELQSLMRISYAVFCLKKKKINNNRYILT